MTKNIRFVLQLFVFALVAAAGGPALAQDTGSLDKGKVVEHPQPYSPYVDQHFPQRVLCMFLKFANETRRIRWRTNRGRAGL